MGIDGKFPLNTEDETEQSYLNSYKNYASQLTPIGNDRSFMVIDSPINENEMLFYAMLFTDEYAHWFIVAFAPEQKESYMPLLYEMLATAVPKK